MTKEPTTPLTFPCHFPIKVIGNNTPTYLEEIFSLTQQRYPDFTRDQIKQTNSKNQTYLAITLTLYAQDQATLDALYHDLSHHPDSKMVL